MSMVMSLWILVLWLILVLSADSEFHSCASSGYLSADLHPQTYLRHFTANRTFVPILGLLDIQCHIQSSFSTWEQQAIPDSSGWSRCQLCALRGQQALTVFCGDGGQARRTAASWSQWNEFFYAEGNDQFRLVYNGTEDKIPKYVVDRPVYVLPMIAFHPGHFLIDVFEQLFTSMLQHYGQVRKDSLIIIDVAAPHQRPFYQKYLQTLVNEAGPLDNIYSLIHAFTNLPVMTHHFIQDLLYVEGGVLFTDLHLVADNSRSHYYRGYKHHPFPLHTAHSQAYLDNYLLFQQHLQHYIKDHQVLSQTSFWKGLPRDTARKALVVTKANNRVIANQREVVRALEAMNFSVIVEDLGELSLQQQISLFAEVDVFVAVAGTAVHNAVFMKPSAVLVVAMQPLWCQYSWMYINQLKMLSMRYLVLCSTSSDFESDAHLHDSQQDGRFYLGVYRKSWRQGPRISKLHSITIDIQELESELFAIWTNATLDKDVALTRYDSQYTPSGNGVYSSSAVQLIVSDVEFPEDHSDTGSVQEGQLKIWYEFLGEQDALCFPLESMNYFSGLKMMMDASVQQSALLQLWIQLSPEGGKVKDSDVFLPIDSRIRPGGGTAIQDWVVNRTVHFGMVLLSYEMHNSRLQGLIVNTAQYDLFLKNSAQQPLPVDPAQRPLLLKVFAKDRYSLQQQLPAWCRQHLLLDSNCALMVQSLYRFLYQWQLIEHWNLPAVQHVPSPSNPFVFLHVDKTGGTTLRDFIVNSTKWLNVSYFIPCYNGVSCMTFDIESDAHGNSEYSAIAGHFFWNIWNTLPASDSNAIMTKPKNVVEPSCFVMTRHPVQRIISLYNQRYFSEAKSGHFQRPIDTFSAEEWERVLIYQRFARVKEDNETVIIVDEGMSDAACRAVLNLRATTGLVNPSAIEVPPELTAEQIKQAIANVKQCIVGVLEEWDETVRIVNHWFPWISFGNKFGRQLNQGNKGDKHLRDELLEVTIRNNPCDMALHNAMLEQFELQKKIINIDVFTQ